MLQIIALRQGHQHAIEKNLCNDSHKISNHATCRYVVYVVKSESCQALNVRNNRVREILLLCWYVLNAGSRTFCMMDNCGNATCVQESVIICLLLRFLYVFPFYLSKVKGNQAFIRNENQRKSIIRYSNHPLFCVL